MRIARFMIVVVAVPGAALAQAPAPARWPAPSVLWTAPAAPLTHSSTDLRLVSDGGGGGHGALIGLLIGAVAGGLAGRSICLREAPDAGACLTGTFMSAAVGGGIGALIGYAIDREKE